MSCPNQKSLLFILAVFLTIFTATAQLSTKHWIPPVHPAVPSSPQDEPRGVEQQVLYLSTPEVVPFEVVITDGAGNPIPGSPLMLSNANPVRIDLGAVAGTFVTTTLADLNKPLSLNRGLILTANKEYYANLRIADINQAGNISSKGTVGLGTDFRLGSFPQAVQESNLSGFFASVMASEDGTVVTFDDYNANVTFLDNTGAGTINNNVITTTLNAGESYVVAGRYNTVANLDGFIGARVSSNKPIVVNTGSMLGATTSVGLDTGIDQLVPVNLVGTEYITIRGNGTDGTENIMVVGTVNNTDIFVNGAAAPIATINAGEHHILDGSNYIGGTHQNMFIETSKPTYLYQILAGDILPNTQGMSFIPPLNCNLLTTIDFIPDIEKIGAVTFEAGVLLTTRKGATVSINATDITDIPEPVTGNPDWETYRILNLTGDTKIESTEAISVGLFGSSGFAGYAGFYSSFGVATLNEIINDVCIKDAPFDVLSEITFVIPPGVTGTWSPIFDNTGASMFDPAVDPSGDYVYTLNDCAMTEIKVTINVEEVIIGALSDIPLCDDDLDGVEEFDFSSAATEALNGQNASDFTFTFHDTMADADTGSNDLGTLYTNTSLTETIYIRMTNTNGCYSFAEFDIEVVQLRANPDATATLDCNVASVTIEANATTTYSGTVDLSYAWSTTDGTIIGAVDADDIVVDAPGTYTVEVTEATTGCKRVASHTINDSFLLPIAVAPDKISVCDGSGTGFTTFNLTIRNAAIIGANTGNLTVTYFTSLADAEANVNSITTPNAYTNVTTSEEIFVRLSNVNASCYDVTSFFIEVIALPEVINYTLPECDTDAQALDGITTFDLTSANASLTTEDVTGLIFNFFESQAAIDANTPIANPTAYRNTNPFNQELLVRVTNNVYFCSNVAELRLEVVQLEITDQPISVIECLGSTTALSVVASGGLSGLVYQWQSSATSGGTFTDVTGATNANYDAPIDTVGVLYYQVIVSDASGTCGSVTSAEAAVTVANGLRIDTQPVGTTECVGTTTELSVVASGGLNGLTYQWQSSASSGGVFADIVGATNTTYNAFTDTVGTIYYQVVISDTGSSCGDITSAEAAVTVTDAPTINTQPISVIECVGSTTALSVVASGGLSGLVYQWQSSATSGGTFTDVTGATNANYDAPIDTVGVLYYQVIVSDASGTCGSVTSAEAAVTVANGLRIDTQPVGTTECVGTTTELSVVASGGLNGLTYQWQSSASSGGVFADIVGATNTTYNAFTDTVGTIYYQVVISDTGSSCGDITSAEAAVTVTDALSIDTQPISVIECMGTTTALNVIASGGVDGLTYQWESSATSGGVFTEVAGQTNATYAAPTNATGTTYYRVVVSDTGMNCGNAISMSAEVTVNQGAVITNQPISVTECIGTTTTLSVMASGTGLTYQWQSSAISGGVFSDIVGATNTTYSASTAAEGSMYYQVKITDLGAICGSVISAEALVTVNAAVTIDTEPIGVIECMGTTTELNVIASGGVDGLTYQWESSATSGGVFTEVAGETNATYEAPTNATGTTYYRVVVSDTGMHCDSVTSMEAEVIVNQVTTIATEPISFTECISTTTVTTLSVTASGGVDGLTYQWESRTDLGDPFTAIAGATNTTYDAPTTELGTTYYQVIVSDTGVHCGEATSSEVHVTINALPEVQEAKLEVCDLDTDNPTASFDGIATFDLTAANQNLTTEDITGLTFEFFESQADIDSNTSIANPTTYRNTNPFNQTLLVVVANGNGCSRVAELRLEVFETISSENMGHVHYACDDNPTDGILEGFFDLEAISAELFTGVNSTLYTSQEDAENERNSISGTAYLSSDATIYAAIEEGNGCSFIKTFELSVLAPPVVLDQEEFKFCTGETQISIEAPIGNDFYNWYFIQENGTEQLVSTDRVLITSVAGFYRLFVENEFDSGTQFLVCSNESFINLIISEPATITGIEVIDFSSNNTVTVLVEGIGDYEYALNNGSFQDSNSFTDVLPDTYTVSVRDKKGCGEVTEEVIVRGFPKFFTPNGDGIHETWTANDIPLELQGSSVNIFDRYGKLLFQFSLGQSGWGGTYSGNLMPSSDYWYSAALNDGRLVKGHFTLKR